MNYLGVTFSSVAFSGNYELILLMRFQGSEESGKDLVIWCKEVLELI